MSVLHLPLYLTALGFWITQQSSSFLLPNATEVLSPAGDRAAGLLWGTGVPRSRRKRYLSPRDMSVILDYHNQARAQVSPPAANMEYMVSRAPAGWGLGLRLLGASVGSRGLSVAWAPSLVGTGHPHMGMSGAALDLQLNSCPRGRFAPSVQGRPMQPLCRKDGVQWGDVSTCGQI